MADAGMVLDALLSGSAKAALLLAAAWALTLALRRSSAAVRHVVWMAALGGALLLPFFSLALPARALRVLPPAVETGDSMRAAPMDPATVADGQVDGELPKRAASSNEMTAAQSSEPTPAEPVAAREPTFSPPPSPASLAPQGSPAPRAPWAVALLVVWLAGALAALAPLLIGWRRVERIAREAEPVGDAEAEALVDRVREQLALCCRVVLLRSARSIVPMVWGVRRPKLLLPAEASAWPRERLHLVLTHELAHVRRGDCISQIVAHLACASYWFNPLAWLALRRLHDEQQRACDDLVLGASVRPSDYAEGLLEATRGMVRPRFVCAAAVAMARQSALGARIDAILDGKRCRRGATRRVVLAATLCAMAVLIPLSQIQALPGSPLIGTAADGKPLYQWSPGESYPDRAQADPRLDEPVAVWRAGISLPDLFTGIAEQTGVSMGVWPADDQNARVRLHLFLNPDEPPALRDLMVQLIWVTDCAFGYTGSGENSTYYLLSTSIGQGAGAAQKAREAKARQEADDLVQALKDRGSEIEEALALTRPEAIDRYLGTDDALLLTLLDPVRRAAAQVVSKHLPRLLETIRFEPALPPNTSQSFGTNIDLFPLPQEDRDAVATAFPTWDVDYEDHRAFCMLSIDSDGRVQLGPPLYHGDPVASWPKSETYVTVMDLSSDIHSRPEDEIALRRALGETIGPAEEEAYVERRNEEITDENIESEKQRRDSRRSLSPDMRERLDGIILSLPGGTHPAWQIEEEVARATGLHLVADGLLDAEAKLSGSTPGEARGLSALMALEAFCNAHGRKFMRDPEWEWGDAGDFLCFRTANRDVWRAAMLPRPLLDWLDAQISSVIPEPDLNEGTAAEFDLPVEAEQWTRWLARLSDLQVQYGALVPDGEPGDPRDAARRATWRAAFTLAEENPPVLRFLASLSAGQWQQARAGALKAPTGLSPEQMQLLEAVIDERGSWNLDLPEGSAITISITQGACESDELWMHDTGASGGKRTYSQEEAGEADWYRVHITARGRLEGHDEERTVLDKQVPFLPASIHVLAGAPRAEESP